MEGDLSLLSIPDLLQMICLGGYSRDIHLFDGAVQLGVIAVRHGRIAHCFGSGASGEAAFYQLVNLRRGRYRVNEARDVGAADQALIAQSWQQLLMEAARLQDEAERVAHAAVANGRVIAFPTPARDAALVTSTRPTRRLSRTIELPGIADGDPRPAPDFARLMDEATASYLRRDLARTEELLRQCLALRPGDRRVLHNLERVRRKKSP
jgi:uncharacterized protein DUF4388